MQMSERLLLARTKLRESQSSFARGIGMKQGSYSDFERGRRTKFSESTLMLMEITFGINPEWVLHEKGDMFISPTGNEATEDLPALNKRITELQREVDRLTEVINKVKQAVA